MGSSIFCAFIRSSARYINSYYISSCKLQVGLIEKKPCTNAESYIHEMGQVCLEFEVALSSVQKDDLHFRAAVRAKTGHFAQFVSNYGSG